MTMYIVTKGVQNKCYWQLTKEAFNSMDIKLGTFPKDWFATDNKAHYLRFSSID